MNTPDAAELRPRCAKDGQTVEWHLHVGGTHYDGSPRTNGEFIGCDFGVKPLDGIECWYCENVGWSSAHAPVCERKPAMATPPGQPTPPTAEADTSAGGL